MKKNIVRPVKAICEMAKKYYVGQQLEVKYKKDGVRHYKIIALYPTYALCKSETEHDSYTESFSYVDLEQIMAGKLLEND